MSSDGASAGGRACADLVLTGGAVTRVWVRDLDLAGDRILGWGRELTAVAGDLSGIAGDPGFPVGVVGPPGTVGLRTDLVGIALGPDGVGAAGGRLTLLGRAVRQVAAHHREVDAATAAALHQVDLLLGQVAGSALAPALLPAGVLGVAAVTARPELGTAALGLLADHPAVTEHLVAAVPGAVAGLAGVGPLPAGVAAAAGSPWPPRDIPALAAGVATVGLVSPWLRETAASRVTSGPWRVGTAPTGVAELVSRIPGDDVRTVRVERVTRPDGVRSWVVAVPGTSTWSARASADPFDLTADVHAMAGQATAASGTVLAAMELAGVPADEPVLLVGHSLGGMVVAGLAADPAVRSRYRITHVVTAGSPVAGFDLPEPVRVLCLEHDRDLVPRLDGAPNPDRDNWLTVSRVGGDQPHSRQEYARTGARVDGVADPVLRSWREGLAPFLAGDGVRSEYVEVTGRREVRR